MDRKDLVELYSLKQELIDLKELIGITLKEDIKEIKSKLDFTNGKIAKAIRDIDDVKKEQDGCLAKKYYSETSTLKDKQDFINKKALLFYGSIFTLFNAIVTIVLPIILSKIFIS